jgi:hypothetical protein
MTTAPERILVRLPNWTGDVVMATPGLRALRSCYAEAQITAHVRPGLAVCPHCSKRDARCAQMRSIWASVCPTPGPRCC